MQHRVRVEVEYFLALARLARGGGGGGGGGASDGDSDSNSGNGSGSNSSGSNSSGSGGSGLPQLQAQLAPLAPGPAELKALATALRSIYLSFSLQDAEKIKALEKVTNHDVKAVEYFIKEKYPRSLIPSFSRLWPPIILDAYGWGSTKEFIHFGLTSQDINNTAIPLALKEFVGQAGDGQAAGTYLAGLGGVVEALKGRAHEWQAVPLLARTHGQPATPTQVGKEVSYVL